MKAVILDGFTTNPGDLSWDWLNEFVDTYTVYDRTAPEEVEERIRDCEIVITNKTLLTPKELDKLTNTVYIGLLSTGYDAVDVAYARTLGIPVSNVPAYSTSAVAQMTFSLLLELTNHVALHNDAIKAGEWQKSRDFCFSKSSLWEISGKTFGIFGYGKIGQAVAAIAKSFGTRVICCTAHPEKYPDADVEFVTLDTLLSESDFISMHCPYTKDTDKIVNRDFLSKMKKTAFLLNTSRGAVIDEDALRWALDNGEIAGAGLDVLSKEPATIDNPVAYHEKCIVTPHIAWAAFETRERLMGIVEDNMRAFFAGKPINIVN